MMINYNVKIKGIKALLIGAGALGLNLYSLLRRQGILFSGIVDKQPNNILRKENVPFFGSINSLPSNMEVDMIVICVPDENVEEIVQDLNVSSISLRQVKTFHTSGTLSYEVLRLLEKKNALIGSFHPMMTFNREELLENIANIPVAVDGDEYMKGFLSSLAVSLNAKPLFVSEEMRPLYHLTGVFASNFMMGLASVMSDVLSELRTRGIDLQMSNMMPIMERSLKLIDSGRPIKDILSGPIRRRDFGVISSHVSIIKKYFPGILSAYREMSLLLAHLCEYSDSEKEKLSGLFLL